MSKPTRWQEFDRDELLVTFSILLTTRDKLLLQEAARRDRVSMAKLVSSWMAPHLRDLRAVQLDAERLAS